MKSNREYGFKLVTALLFIVLIISLIFLGFSLVEKHIINKSDSKKLSNLSDDMFGNVKYNGATYEPRRRLTNILIMGLDDMGDIEDSESYTNRQQADFLALVALDKAEGTYSVIHINRDTMTDIPVLAVNGEKIGTLNTQIALSHTYGKGLDDSCRNTVDAVSDLLCGIRIDSYISLTMGGVQAINDLLGGVEVEVLDDFSAVDPTLIKGEKVNLTGEHALTYVRTRRNVGDETNLARMARQKQYISAFMEKFRKEYESDGKLAFKAVEKAGSHMITDLTVKEISSLSDCISTYAYKGIVSPKGESIMGSKNIEHYVDKDSLIQLVLDTFYKKR